MEKIAFYTNMPSPYRVDFFNELGKHCDLYVFFEMKKSSGRDISWISTKYQNFTPIFLEGKAYSGECAYCPNIIKQYKAVKPDVNVVCDALSLTGIKLINYFIKKKIKYIVEGDGAFDKKCSLLKGAIKRRVFSKAEKLFYTSNEHKKYLLRYGGQEEKMVKYPFSSVCDSEIINIKQKATKKEEFRKSLHLGQKDFIYLTASRFLDLKNIETIIEAFGLIKINNSKLIIVGGEPIPSYTEIIERKKINNVIFIPFIPKNEIFKYMLASDCFVFASLSDIWGLVINEAIANGMPIISSETTLSSVELKSKGAKISLFKGKDIEELSNLMIGIYKADKGTIANIEEANIKTAHKFTIEAMAKKHIEELIEKSV